MKCYNHAENDAVGVCKNCSKGLCKECLTEVNYGIACTLTCIEEVERIDKLIKKGSQSYKTVYASQMRNAYLIGSMGIVFIFFGITSINSCTKDYILLYKTMHSFVQKNELFCTRIKVLFA